MVPIGKGPNGVEAIEVTDIYWPDSPMGIMTTWQDPQTGVISWGREAEVGCIQYWACRAYSFSPTADLVAIVQGRQRRQGCSELLQRLSRFEVEYMEA